MAKREDKFPGIFELDKYYEVNSRPKTEVLAIETRTSLIQQIGSIVVVYRRWQYRLSCSRESQDRSGGLYVPSEKVFDETGAIYSCCRLERIDWSYRETSDSNRRKYIRYGSRSRFSSINWQSAWCRYLLEIPQDIRCIANEFGRYQWLALEAMGQCSALRFKFTNGSMKCFAIAVFTLDMTLTKPISHRRKVYKAIAFSRERCLVEELLGLPGSKMVVNILKKWHDADRHPLEDSAWAIKYLVTRCSEANIAKALCHAESIWIWTATFLKYLPSWLVTPSLIRNGLVLRHMEHEELACFGLLLDEAKDKPSFENVKRRIVQVNRSLNGFRDPYEIFDQWLGITAHYMTLPAPPVQWQHPLRPLASLNAIQEHGKVMNNCLRNLSSRGEWCVYSGQSYYFAWNKKPAATIRICNRFNNPGWEIDECEHEDRTPLSSAELEEVLTAFCGAVRSNSFVPCCL